MSKTFIPFSKAKVLRGPKTALPELKDNAHWIWSCSCPPVHVDKGDTDASQDRAPGLLVLLDQNKPYMDGHHAQHSH